MQRSRRRQLISRRQQEKGSGGNLDGSRTCSSPPPRYPAAANEIIHLGLARREVGRGRPAFEGWPHGGAVEARSLILLIRAISVKSRSAGRTTGGFPGTRASDRRHTNEKGGKKKNGKEAEVEGFPY